jgi:hypothetical protein
MTLTTWPATRREGGLCSTDGGSAITGGEVVVGGDGRDVVCLASIPASPD